MNRIQFLNSTYKDNIEFFDHIIAAYEIMKDTHPNKVLSNINKINSSLTIQIGLDKLPEIHSTVNYINNIIHHHKCIYGKDFNINIDIINNDQIELFIKDETFSNLN